MYLSYLQMLEVGDQNARMVGFLVRTVFLLCRWQSLLYPHSGESREREEASSLLSLLLMALIPPWELYSHNLLISQRPPHLNTINLGVRISIYKLWGTQIFGLWHFGCYYFSGNEHLIMGWVTEVKWWKGCLEPQGPELRYCRAVGSSFDYRSEPSARNNWSLVSLKKTSCPPYQVDRNLLHWASEYCWKCNRVLLTGRLCQRYARSNICSILEEMISV